VRVCVCACVRACVWVRARAYVCACMSEPTELSRPSVSNIMKKSNDQNVAPGSVAMASGYTTKTNPGPIKTKQIQKTNRNQLMNKIHIRAYTNTYPNLYDDNNNNNNVYLIKRLF